MKIGDKTIRHEFVMFMIVFVAMVIHMYNAESLQMLLDRFYLSAFVVGSLYLVLSPMPQKEES